jgi:hypothetical protein
MSGTYAEAPPGIPAAPGDATEPSASLTGSVQNSSLVLNGSAAHT